MHCALFHRREVSHADRMLGDAVVSSLARRGARARSRAWPGMDRSAWRVGPVEFGAGSRTGDERGNSGGPADARGGGH